jgi:HEAT repeat protein
MPFFRPASALVLLLLAGCATTESLPGVEIGRETPAGSARLRQQVDEMQFLNGQQLLQRMTYLASLGEEAVPALTAGSASGDWLVRSSCMWVFERMGDRRHLPVVAARLEDPVPVVRYQAATTLVKLGDQRGLRTLVEGLADGDLQNRYKCFQALRVGTGKEFGYRHDGAPDERRQAVSRWLDWLDGVQASAL